MNPTLKQQLVNLAKRDLANAQDNLLRAKSAANTCDPSAQWGQSGRTLQEIIDGYADWEREAIEAVSAAEAL